MKIEKINDRQIRCTLTREDLATRELKLSELAYGSDKARALFQDMMQVAAQDFGFEADNTPLVIEAVPVSVDSIILIITKVDDPEELDTRFARFSPEDTEQDGGLSLADLKDRIEGADDVLGLIRKITEAKKRAMQAEQAGTAVTKETPQLGDASSAEHSSDAQKASSAAEAAADEEVRSLTRFYLFHSLDDAIRAAAVLASVYDGPNSLYKDPAEGVFYLLLQKADNSAEQFNKVCNILSEYALSCKYIPGTDAYFTEHMELILQGNALQDLAQLS
jgi:adapter protein MecA 1/2